MKYIRSASAPSFGTARTRSCTWVSAAARRSGSASAAPAQGGRGADGIAVVVGVRGRGGLDQALAVVGEQPAERREIHAGILSAGGVATAIPDPPSTRPG